MKRGLGSYRPASSDENELVKRARPRRTSANNQARHSWTTGRPLDDRIAAAAVGAIVANEVMGNVQHWGPPLARATHQVRRCLGNSCRTVFNGARRVADHVVYGARAVGNHLVEVDRQIADALIPRTGPLRPNRVPALSDGASSLINQSEGHGVPREASAAAIAPLPHATVANEGSPRMDGIVFHTEDDGTLEQERQERVNAARASRRERRGRSERREERQ
jgi:hypothetical protein